MKAYGVVQRRSRGFQNAYRKVAARSGIVSEPAVCSSSPTLHAAVGEPCATEIRSQPNFRGSEKFRNDRRGLRGRSSSVRELSGGIFPPAFHSAIRKNGTEEIRSRRELHGGRPIRNFRSRNGTSAGRRSGNRLSVNEGVKRRLIGIGIYQPRYGSFERRKASQHDRDLGFRKNCGHLKKRSRIGGRFFFEFSRSNENSRGRFGISQVSRRGAAQCHLEFFRIQFQFGVIGASCGIVRPRNVEHSAGKNRRFHSLNL